MTLNDKVQTGESTAGTSTSTTTWRSSPPTEYGWACPRCGRINAPWKSQCDCSGYGYYPTWEWSKPYYDEWWKHVTCAPETTWKAPSSVCTSDSNTYKDNGTTTAWNANSAMDTGGSDYWNSCTKAWENVSHTFTNMQKELDEIKSTFSNTLKGE